MKEATFVGAGSVSAVLTCDGAIAAVTFYPGGEIDHHQLGPDLAAALFRTISAHFAAHRTAPRMIQYRGDLAPIAIGDLALFGVPILLAP